MAGRYRQRHPPLGRPRLSRTGSRTKPRGSRNRAGRHRSRPRRVVPRGRRRRASSLRRSRTGRVPVVRDRPARQPGRGRPPCRAQTRPRQAPASPPQLLQLPPRPRPPRTRRCRSPNCRRPSTCRRSSARCSPAGRTAGSFERSLDQTSAGKPWTFYEGPPTANGMPGVHHVEARVFKDLFPRFKTMQGFHVPRQGGWDCHGLPVEVAVEQELGVSGKKEIEAYGIAEFNARCRESVLRHVDAFEALTERMGYWVDLQHAYRTMDPDYIESVWWSLKVIFDEGLLIRDYRISPVLPALRDPAVRPRDGPAGRLPDGVRPLGHRPLPAAHRSRTGRIRSSTARTCWCGRPRRGRWCPTPRSPFTPTRPTWSPASPATATVWSSPSPCSAGCSARAGTSWPGSAAPSSPEPPTSRRSTWCTCPTRTWSSPARS